MIKYMRLSEVREGMVAGDHIFSPNENALIVLRHSVLDTHTIGLLKQHGVTLAPIDTGAKTLPDEDPQADLPPIQPILDEKLRDEALGGIRRMFHAVGEGTSEANMTTAYQAVKEVDTVVDQLVDTLSAEAKALIHIADLKSYDEYTYHHSLSVAVLSIAIGQSMGLPDRELRRLGRCAMMHDIGKTLVPVEIINKPSRLSATEFSIIKQHSRFGYDYLVKGNIGDEAFRQVVLCHHEKLDGTGYPNGLKRNVPLMSRIISVADVYDAVTSYRPYRSPMPPAEAMELIMSELGFDYDIVKAFVNKLEPYPIHTCVELSDHRRGVVIDNHNAMRPIIRMLDTQEVMDLLDLHHLHLVITRVLNDTRRPEHPESVE